MKNTKLSVMFPGKGWFFAVATNKVREDAGISYYRIDRKFGTVAQKERDPTKLTQVGSIGDYLAKDSFGTLTIMKKKVYEVLFPNFVSSASMHPAPLSSEALKDPNFLTKIAERTPQPEYNTTQRSTSTTRTTLY